MTNVFSCRPNLSRRAQFLLLSAIPGTTGDSLVVLNYFPSKISAIFSKGNKAGNLFNKMLFTLSIRRLARSLLENRITQKASPSTDVQSIVFSFN